MATDLQRNRLRYDIGATSTTLSDAEADAIFVEAAETHATAGDAQTALTRVIAIRRLLASSAKLTSYRQNASSENLSDIFKHLQELLKLWRDEEATAITSASSSGAARFGGLRQKPKRVVEYPDRA